MNISIIKYRISWETKNVEPGLVIEPNQGKLWTLSELNSCDSDYILDEVLPNIKNIWTGGKYWDPYRSPTYGAFDTYEFGYDATMIDFGKEKSVISYGFWEGSIEVPSEEIYTLMQEWGKYLREWKNNKTSL